MRSFSNVYKLMVAGDGGVGKTTLLFQYVKGTFVENTGMTIGVQFHAKDVTLEGVFYSLQLWDLGGQDRFRFMLPSYTLGAKGALLLYDMTSMSSLETLEEWVTICRTHNKTMPILLCGTKADLASTRSVQEDYAKSFLQSLNLFDHLEISAKTGQNVEKAFKMIVNAIIKESPKTT
jgi:small GTP-binding protein